MGVVFGWGSENLSRVYRELIDLIDLIGLIDLIEKIVLIDLIVLIVLIEKIDFIEKLSTINPKLNPQQRLLGSGSPYVIDALHECGVVADMPDGQWVWRADDEGSPFFLCLCHAL